MTIPEKHVIRLDFVNETNRFVIGRHVHMMLPRDPKSQSMYILFCAQNIQNTPIKYLNVLETTMLPIIPIPQNLLWISYKIK